MKALIALALAASTLSASALEIAGMQVDRQVNCDLLTFTSAGIDVNCVEKKELEWTTTIEFLDRQTPVMISRNSRGVLKSVVMTAFDYDRAISAMRVQFGKPASTTRDETIWVKQDQSIRVSRYGGLGSMLVYAGKAAEK